MVDTGNSRINWHRLFGLFLHDFFLGLPFEVELEKELAKRRQYLDVVVVRKSTGALDRALPDGFDDMAAHNLISFKSLRGKFDGWAVDELIGHYVNYRKQVHPRGTKMLPERDFRLYAVCVRFPQALAKREGLKGLSPGVFELPWHDRSIRILVTSRMRETDANALPNILSAERANIGESLRRIPFRSERTRAPVMQLLAQYAKEGIDVPYTPEDFDRDFKEEFISNYTMEERVRGVPPEERVRGVPPEERVRGLSVEERLVDLSPEEAARAIEELARIAQKQTSPTRKSRKE